MKMPDYFNNQNGWWLSYTDLELDEMLHERIIMYTEQHGDCLVWKRGKDKDGYGCITFMMKSLRVHREIYRIHKGAIPKGKFICHSCDNPSCCNIEHLFLGTPRDNTIDMIKKNRNLKNRGELHHKSKLTEKDVIRIRKLLELGVSGANLAREYGITGSSMSSIKLRQSWKHL